MEGKQTITFGEYKRKGYPDATVLRVMGAWQTRCNRMNLFNYLDMLGEEVSFEIGEDGKISLKFQKFMVLLVADYIRVIIHNRKTNFCLQYSLFLFPLCTPLCTSAFSLSLSMVSQGMGNGMEMMKRSGMGWNFHISCERALRISKIRRKI